MPELPEITLYRNYVNQTSLKKMIRRIEFPDPSLLQDPEENFINALKGKRFENSRRLGKYLSIEISGGKSLIFHFGMTGKLHYYTNQEDPKYSKMIITFEDGYSLAYICRRKLGKIYLAENIKAFQSVNSLGADALEISEKEFLEALEGKTGNIKGVLTDQHVLSGIGNVYADEMLYQIKVHPKSKTSEISDSDKKKLFRKMRKVLEIAIAKEGERENFPSSYLIKNRKEGAKCPGCSGKVKKISIGGRSTYFCPSCQKEM